MQIVPYHRVFTAVEKKGILNQDTTSAASAGPTSHTSQELVYIRKRCAHSDK
jgi:hypothetical protein